MENYNITYAGFWIRFVACLIDGILLTIVLIPISILIGLAVVFMGGVDTTLSSILGGIVGFIVGVVYYVGMHASSKQATVGKMIMGLQVIGKNGERISFMRAFGRYVATYISSIFYIGYIIAGFHPEKRSLHDLMAGTYVIKKQKKLHFNN